MPYKHSSSFFSGCQARRPRPSRFPPCPGQTYRRKCCEIGSIAGVYPNLHSRNFERKVPIKDLTRASSINHLCSETSKSKKRNLLCTIWHNLWKIPLDLPLCFALFNSTFFMLIEYKCHKFYLAHAELLLVHWNLPLDFYQHIFPTFKEIDKICLKIVDLSSLSYLHSFCPEYSQGLAEADLLIGDTSLLSLKVTLQFLFKRQRSTGSKTRAKGRLGAVFGSKLHCFSPSNGWRIDFWVSVRRKFEFVVCEQQSKIGKFNSGTCPFPARSPTGNKQKIFSQMRGISALSSTDWDSPILALDPP